MPPGSPTSEQSERRSGTLTVVDGGRDPGVSEAATFGGAPWGLLVRSEASRPDGS